MSSTALLPAVDIYNQNQRKELSYHDLLTLKAKAANAIKAYSALQKISLIAMLITAIGVTFIAATQQDRDITHIFVTVDIGLMIIISFGILAAILHMAKKGHERKLALAERELAKIPGIELV